MHMSVTYASQHNATAQIAEVVASVRRQPDDERSTSTGRPGGRECGRGGGPRHPHPRKCHLQRPMVAGGTALRSWLAQSCLCPAWWSGSRSQLSIDAASARPPESLGPERWHDRRRGHACRQGPASARRRGVQYLRADPRPAVAATAPPKQLVRALARSQISTGIGQAAAPAVITWLLSADPLLLWATLTASTLLSAAVISRRSPTDRQDGRLPGEPNRFHQRRRAALQPTSQEGLRTRQPPSVALEWSLRIPGTATSVGELPTRPHHGRVPSHGVANFEAGAAGMLAAQVRSSPRRHDGVPESDVT
jgi:hypothetical protein